MNFDGFINGTFMTFLDPVSSDILFGQIFFFNDYHDSVCPVSTRNKDTSYFLIAVPETLKKTLKSPQIRHLCFLYLIFPKMIIILL